MKNYDKSVRRKRRIKVLLYVIFFVTFTVMLYLGMDWAFKAPIVYKSVTSGEVVRVEVDGKTVPESQWAEVLERPHNPPIMVE